MFEIGILTRNWNCIHSVFRQYAASVTLLRLCPKRDRNLSLDLVQTVDWITPDTTRLNFPRDCACAQGHAGPWTRLGSGCWPVDPSIDRATDRMKVVTSADMFTANAFTHTPSPSPSPKMKRKAGEKEQECRKSCIIGRSLIWPYTPSVLYPRSSCIVSLGRRLSHSHFGQVFDSLFWTPAKWHAYYFYGHTAAVRRRNWSTLAYPTHADRLLKSQTKPARSVFRVGDSSLSQLNLVFPFATLHSDYRVLKVHDTHNSIIYNNRVLFGYPNLEPIDELCIPK